MEVLNPDVGTIEQGGAVAITGNLVISARNARAYDGKTLVFTGAFTVTLAAGLPPAFGFAVRPPASGNASIASDGTVLLNDATTTLTRDRATNTLFAVAVVARDSYAVTGS